MCVGEASYVGAACVGSTDSQCSPLVLAINTPPLSSPYTLVLSINAPPLPPTSTVHQRSPLLSINAPP